MTDVTDTQGTLLKRGGTLGVASSGTTIPKVRSIGEMGWSSGLRDVTVLSDTIHQHKLGIPDMSEIAVELYYDQQEPMHAQIFQDAVNKSLAVWQVWQEQGNSPDEQISFTAYVINPKINPAEVDGDFVLSFSLKPQSMFGGMFDVIGTVP